MAQEVCRNPPGLCCWVKLLGNAFESSHCWEWWIFVLGIGRCVAQWDVSNSGNSDEWANSSEWPVVQYKKATNFWESIDRLPNPFRKWQWIQSNRSVAERYWETGVHWANEPNHSFRWSASSNNQRMLAMAEYGWAPFRKWIRTKAKWNKGSKGYWQSGNTLKKRGWTAL